MHTITLPSGLSYRDLRSSDGAPVAPGDRVRVHYQAGLGPDVPEAGPWIDDSWPGETPVAFVVGAGVVLRGLDEGIVGMRVASYRRMTVPPALAFGERGVPGLVPPDATLTLQLYVIDIQERRSATPWT